MSRCLILQVLGNSDLEPKNIAHIFDEVELLEDLEKGIGRETQKYKADGESVNFPFIALLNEQKPQNIDYTFCILLTDQRKLLPATGLLSDDEKRIAKSDGHWWGELLALWCQNKGISFQPIDLAIAPETRNGVANWEAMAELIEKKLTNIIGYDLETEKFSAFESTFNQIIIQHSSGTPALSSALYLWGIEQRLADRNIEFVYLAQEGEGSSSFPHQASHWQWRLKVPQVRQLLEIQDFGGALELVHSKPRFSQCIKNKLVHLDKSASLNLNGRNDLSCPKDEVIERISIALWCERGFRSRRRWSQWFALVAGAFELSILCLVENQAKLLGNNSFSWKKNNNRKVIFKYHDSANPEIEVKSSISVIVQELLHKGLLNVNGCEFTVKPMNGNQLWNDFKKFYCDSWILQGGSHAVGFITFRNAFYHSLIADDIDEILDSQADSLGSSDNSAHPSQIAMHHLNFLIDQADIRQVVNLSAERYKNQVQEIKELL